jgi:hypothetical protein
LSSETEVAGWILAFVNTPIEFLAFLKRHLIVTPQGTSPLLGLDFHFNRGLFNFGVPKTHKHLAQQLLNVPDLDPKDRLTVESFLSQCEE